MMSLHGIAGIICEVQGARFMEATAASTAEGQETALKSNWILTHSFLLFIAITVSNILHECDP